MLRRPSVGTGTVGESNVLLFVECRTQRKRTSAPVGLARKEGEAMSLTSDTLVQCFFFFCFFLSANGAVV